MEEKNHTKRRFGLFVVLIALFVIITLVVLSDRTIAKNDLVVEDKAPLAVKQCFIWNTEDGDKATLLLTTIDTNVEGSFSFLPSEKDSKRGVFTGTLSSLAGNSSIRTIHGWWNVLSEGMNTKEEILISLRESTAVIGFGEMKDNGDGSYVYADVTKLLYQPVLQETSCDDLSIFN